MARLQSRFNSVPQNYYDNTESDFDYPVDDGYSGFNLGVTERPNFNTDALKYAKSLSMSQYQHSALGHVANLPITSRYRSALYSCIFSLFAEERVLAYNDMIRSRFGANKDPLEIHLLCAQRDIEKCRCSATKPDLAAFDTAGFEKHILGVFQAYISRTLGAKKERYINSELSTRSVNQAELPLRDFNPAPKKKGLLGGLIGGGR